MRWYYSVVNRSLHKSKDSPMNSKRMPFDKLKELISTKNFTSMRQYHDWVREVKSPAIPLHPHSSYAKSGWKGSNDFLSKNVLVVSNLQSIQGRRGALIQHYGENPVNKSITVTESNTNPIVPVAVQPKDIELNYRDKSNALFILAKSGYMVKDLDSVIDKIDWTIDDAKKMAKDLLALRLGVLQVK